MSIEYLCIMHDGGRGIWKQVDENRELLMKLLEKNDDSWISTYETWIHDTDFFMLCLMEILGFKKLNDYGRIYPRQWPGKEYSNIEERAKACADEIIRTVTFLVEKKLNISYKYYNNKEKVELLNSIDFLSDCAQRFNNSFSKGLTLYSFLNL